METTPFLRPTALQQLRGFLAESGAGLPPWSTSDEVMDELVGLLHSRRGDPAFFTRLTPFIEELRDHAQRGQSGLAAHDAEVLSRASVESIVEELQTRLRGASRSTSAAVVCSVIGDKAARLLCLALLSSGLVACTQPSSDSSTSAEPGTPAPVPTPPTPRPPAPPVVAAPAGGTDALVEMFKNKSPQEAAGELERAMDAGKSPGLDQPLRDPKNAPRYKGVDLT